MENQQQSPDNKIEIEILKELRSQSKQIESIKKNVQFWFWLFMISVMISFLVLVVYIFTGGL
jgi:hypothetical protein